MRWTPWEDIVQQGRAYGIDSGFFSKLELSQRTAYPSQISSNIIKYHQISSHIITYHHISPVVKCCQIYDQKSSSRLNPKASNLRRTTCREASLGYRGRGSQQVQEQFFQAPIGLEDRAPLESGGCIPFVHQKKQDIFGGLFNVWCEHVYKDGCLPVATPKKMNMICDYFDMNLVLYRGAIIGQVMIVLLQPSGLK